VNLHLMEAKTTLSFLTVNLDCYLIQFNALMAKLGSLKRSKLGATLNPRLMVYACLEEPIIELTSCSNDTTFIGVMVFLLYSFPFLHNDVVVSLCRHVYHLFYTLVVFVKDKMCMARDCTSVSH